MQLTFQSDDKGRKYDNWESLSQPHRASAVAFRKWRESDVGYINSSRRNRAIIDRCKYQHEVHPRRALRVRRR